MCACECALCEYVCEYMSVPVSVHVCVWCMYAYTHIGGEQSKAWGILLYHCPPIPLRQGLLPILEVGWQPASLRNPPVSNLPHSEQAHLAMHMAAGDLNLGPHIHLANLSHLLSHSQVV